MFQLDEYRYAQLLLSTVLCAGALVGAVAGEVLLGWAREEDVETDRDVERQMDRAAERVGAWVGSEGLGGREGCVPMGCEVRDVLPIAAAMTRCVGQRGEGCVTRVTACGLEG